MAGLRYDVLGEEAPKPTLRPQDDIYTEFGKGLRSGLTSTGGGLRRIAGTLAEAFGADDFAKQQYAAGQAADAQAQAEAPSITSYEQVLADPSLRNIGTYGAGLLGGSVPSIAAGVGAGLVARTPLRGLAFGTLAQTPIEAADVANKQAQDPTAMQQSAGERLMRQAGGGLGSAALQTVVPNMVAGKMLGRGAEQAAKQTLKQTLMHNAMAIPEEGFFEGASEALKQGATNEQKPLDWHQIAENAIGGAVAGAPMAGAGAVGDVLHGTPRKGWIAAKDAVQGAVGTAQTALEPHWQAVMDSKVGQGLDKGLDAAKAAYADIMGAEDVPAAVKAKAAEAGKNFMNAANRGWLMAMSGAKEGAGMAADTASNVAEDIGTKLRNLNNPADDTEDRIISGTPLGDLKAMATAQGEELLRQTQESAGKAAEWTKNKAAELYKRADLTPEQRQTVEQAAQDVTDRGSQIALGTLSKAKKGWDTFKRKLSVFASSVRESHNETADEGTKKSADYSGLDEQIKKVVVPLISQKHPEILQDSKAVQELGASLRMLGQSMSENKNEKTSALLAHLSDMLSPETATSVMHTISSAITNGDVAANTRYFGKMSSWAEQEKNNTDLLTLLKAKHSNEASGRSGFTGNIDELAKHLTSWARGELTGKTRAETEYNDRVVKDFLDQHYGTNAGAILNALEKSAKLVNGTAMDQGAGTEAGRAAADQEGHGLDWGDRQSVDEREVKARYYSKEGEGGVYTEYDHPDYAKGKAGYDSATEQALKRVREKNPDARVSFVTLRDYGKAAGMDEGQIANLAQGRDPGTRGYIKIEKLDSNEGLQGHQLRQMRMAEKYANTGKGDAANAIYVDGKSKATAYDSTRIADVMHKDTKDEWTDADNKGGWARRLATKFAEGVAALETHHLREAEDFASEQARATAVAKGLSAEQAAQAGGDAAAKVAGERGKPFLKLHDKLVIGQAGGKALTWGEAKKLISQDSGPGKGTKGEQMAREHLPELSDQELSAYERRVQDGYDARKEAARAQIIAEMKDDPQTVGLSVRAWKAEFKARMAAAEKDEKTGLPAANRTLMAVRNEQGRRTGEDRRSQVLGTGMETREGYQPTGKMAAQSNATEHFLRSKADAEGSTARGDGMGSGMMEGDPEGQIHAADATVNREDLARNNPELGRKGLDQKPLMAAAMKLEMSESPARQGMVNRLNTILSAWHGLGKEDQQTLLLAASLPPSELDAVVKTVAKKHQDLLHLAPSQKNAPAQSAAKGEIAKNPVRFKAGKVVEVVGESKTGATLAQTIDARTEYLNNPPDSYKPEHADQIRTWAEKQLARVEGAQSEVPKDNYDRLDELSDMKSALRRLIDKAKSVAEGDESLKDFEGGTPDPKVVAAKKAAFLGKAASGDATLLKELATSNDAKGLQRAAQALIEAGQTGAALDTINKRLDELVQNPEVAYGLQTVSYSLDATKADRTQGMSAKGREHILDAIHRMLGDSVLVETPFLAHAGEFLTDMGEDVIRVSAHAMDPMGTAYHESLHAFFKQLRTHGVPEAIETLQRVTQKPAVMARLRELLAHSPEALQQLTDPEERAAYLFQFWANGDEKLTKALGEKPATLFQQIADFFRRVLGIWTDDERAVHTMEYLSSGDYAKDMKSSASVRKALVESGKNRTLERWQQMAKPLTNLAETLVGAGGANMRDSGIDAFERIADLVKKPYTDEGADRGYIPAARSMKAKFIHEMAVGMQGASEEDIRSALEALQRNETVTGPGAAVQAAVRRMLDDVYTYANDAGVKLGDQGFGRDYFPRRWDPTYLAKHKDEFMAMAEKYPEFKNPEGAYMALINADGTELPVVMKPGMTSKYARKLDFLSNEDVAPFMDKDILKTLDGYVGQATRRAEWARRLGDKNEVLNELLKQAEQQGATKEQLQYAKDYVEGVNGTLGDDLNPTLRRYMGNMIVYQNIRLLPLAIFSSLVDPMGIVVRGGSVRDAFGAFKRGIAEIPKGLKGKGENDVMTDLAETMGVIENSALQHTLGATYTQGMVGDTAQKWNDTFFRFNLMEQFNVSMRVGAMEAALKFMAKHGDGKASAHSGRWMAELGLQKGDVRIVNGRVALTQAEGLSEAQEARMRAAVNQWVDGAVLRPDAADKPVWMNDPHWMLVAHLKQFVYSFQHTILARVAHEAKNGNYGPALALGSYVPVMIAADLLKGLIQGGGDQPEWKKDWSAQEYLADGVQRAGLLGVGQFAVDAVGAMQRGGTGLGELAGPSLEQMGDAAQVVGGHGRFAPFFVHSLPANSVYNSAFNAPQDGAHHPE